MTSLFGELLIYPMINWVHAFFMVNFRSLMSINEWGICFDLIYLNCVYLPQSKISLDQSFFIDCSRKTSTCGIAVQPNREQPRMPFVCLQKRYIFGVSTDISIDKHSHTAFRRSNVLDQHSDRLWSTQRNCFRPHAWSVCCARTYVSVCFVCPSSGVARNRTVKSIYGTTIV